MSCASYEVDDSVKTIATWVSNWSSNGIQIFHAWIDSMRTSSPTHIKLLPFYFFSKQQLNSWIISDLHIALFHKLLMSLSSYNVFLYFRQMQYPSAYKCSRRSHKLQEGNNCNVSWLWRHSLSPIVDDLDKAFISSKVCL